MLPFHVQGDITQLSRGLVYWWCQKGMLRRLLPGYYQSFNRKLCDERNRVLSIAMHYTIIHQLCSSFEAYCDAGSQLEELRLFRTRSRRRRTEWVVQGWKRSWERGAIDHSSAGQNSRTEDLHRALKLPRSICHTYRYFLRETGSDTAILVCTLIYNFMGFPMGLELIGADWRLASFLMLWTAFLELRSNSAFTPLEVRRILITGSSNVYGKSPRLIQLYASEVRKQENLTIQRVVLLSTDP